MGKKALQSMEPYQGISTEWVEKRRSGQTAEKDQRNRLSE